MFHERVPRDSEQTRITRLNIDPSETKPPRLGEACLVVIYGPELGRRVQCPATPACFLAIVCVE